MGFLTNENLGQDSDKCKKYIYQKQKHTQKQQQQNTPKPDNSETNHMMQKKVVKIIVISLHNWLHKGPINIMAEQLHHDNQTVISQNFLPA